jgi:hypothetical protein
MTDLIADGPRRSEIFPLFEKETPAHRANDEYQKYVDEVSMERRRELGQFFTPLSVAKFRSASWPRRSRLKR